MKFERYAEPAPSPESMLGGLMSPERANDLFMRIMSAVEIDFDHDIPYLAGYSTDGGTIYVDRDCPMFIGSVPVYKLIVIHEYTEKSLIDRGMHYRQAHELAERAELDRAIALGIDWDDYMAELERYVKRAEHGAISAVPADLDMTPYVDMMDFDEIAKIEKAERDGATRRRGEL